MYGIAKYSKKEDIVFIGRTVSLKKDSSSKKNEENSYVLLVPVHLFWLHCILLFTALGEYYSTFKPG